MKLNSKNPIEIKREAYSKQLPSPWGRKHKNRATKKLRTNTKRIPTRRPEDINGRMLFDSQLAPNDWYRGRNKGLGVAIHKGFKKRQQNLSQKGHKANK